MFSCFAMYRVHAGDRSACYSFSNRIVPLLPRWLEWPIAVASFGGILTNYVTNISDSIVEATDSEVVSPLREIDVHNKREHDSEDY